VEKGEFRTSTEEVRGSHSLNNFTVFKVCFIYNFLLPLLASSLASFHHVCLIRHIRPSLLGTSTDNVIHTMVTSGLDAGNTPCGSFTAEILAEYLGV